MDLSSGNRADRVFHRIRADILSVSLKPSQKLRIADLTEKYQVSLGVVREALSRLVADGLVVTESQKGFRVAPVDTTDLIHLTEARIRIEHICLAESLAAANITWESEVMAAHHCLAHIPPLIDDDVPTINPSWANSHARFHSALVAGCKNTWLLRMRHMMQERSERYRWLSVPIDAGQRDVASEHKGIADAALARDLPGLNELIAAHFNRTTQIILSGPGLRVAAE